jgi:hypothetical protein
LVSPAKDIEEAIEIIKLTAILEWIEINSLKVSFRSLQDLDDYLESRFRRMLLKDESERA